MSSQSIRKDLSQLMTAQASLGAGVTQTGVIPPSDLMNEKFSQQMLALKQQQALQQQMLLEHFQNQQDLLAHQHEEQLNLQKHQEIIDKHRQLEEQEHLDNINKQRIAQKLMSRKKDIHEESANASAQVKERLHEFLLNKKKGDHLQCHGVGMTGSNPQIHWSLNQGSFDQYGIPLTSLSQSIMGQYTNFPLRKTASEPNLKVPSRMKQKVQERRSSPLLRRRDGGASAVKRRITAEMTDDSQSAPGSGPSSPRNTTLINETMENIPEGYPLHLLHTAVLTGNVGSSLYTSPSLPNISLGIHGTPTTTHQRSNPNVQQGAFQIPSVGNPEGHMSSPQFIQLPGGHLIPVSPITYYHPSSADILPTPTVTGVPTPISPLVTGEKKQYMYSDLSPQINLSGLQALQAKLKHKTQQLSRVKSTPQINDSKSSQFNPITNPTHTVILNSQQQQQQHSTLHYQNGAREREVRPLTSPRSKPVRDESMTIAEEPSELGIVDITDISPPISPLLLSHQHQYKTPQQQQQPSGHHHGNSPPLGLCKEGESLSSSSLDNCNVTALPIPAPEYRPSHNGPTVTSSSEVKPLSSPVLKKHQIFQLRNFQQQQQQSPVSMSLTSSSQQQQQQQQQQPQQQHPVVSPMGLDPSRTVNDSDTEHIDRGVNNNTTTTTTTTTTTSTSSTTSLKSQTITGHTSLSRAHSSPATSSVSDPMNCVGVEGQDDSLFTTGIAFDTIMLKHQCMCGNNTNHPEHAGRLQSIWSRLQEKGLVTRCRRIHVRCATREELLSVHTESHTLLYGSSPSSDYDLDELYKKVFNKLPCGGVGVDSDTVWNYIHTGRAAKTAVGCVLELAFQIATGQLKNGLAIVRPPGHHAEAHQAMGFCYFNSIAISAKQLRHKLKLKRILILDWDIHHGNGTQQAFYNDSNVLYISIHRYDAGNFFPGTGASKECGVGRGLGYNINIAWEGDLQPPMADKEYLAAFRCIVMPILRQFDPDIILVSAGFDPATGHPAPIGGYRVSSACFGHMTHRLMSQAGGRVVLVLEGGYDLQAICNASEVCLQVLIGEQAPCILKSELMTSPSDIAIKVLEETISIQSKYWPVLKRYTSTLSYSYVDALKLEIEETETVSAFASLGINHIDKQQQQQQQESKSVELDEAMEDEQYL